MSTLASFSDDPSRIDELIQEHHKKIINETNKMFVGLMIMQWIAGMVFAVFISPKTWIGNEYEVHIHIWMALVLGGLVSSLPIYMSIKFPYNPITRYIIAFSQMLWSGMLIHLSGGRIETHFHVFGSLAFLVFYRDARVLIVATVVVAVDHFIRGVWWPQSVFGIFIESPFRWIEHAAWVVFEVAILLKSCATGTQEMKEIAQRQSRLEKPMNSLNLKSPVEQRNCSKKRRMQKRPI